MRKIVCNVYKDAAHWTGGPPGIGDFIRGSAWLLELAASGRHPGLEAGINLALAPAAPWLNRTPHWHEADESVLAAAPQYFTPDRFPDLDRAIKRFIASDEPALLVSTNRSWSGLDDAPCRAALDRLRAVFDAQAEPDPAMATLKRSVGPNYRVLHIRDEDRTSPFSEQLTTEAAFRDRVDAALDRQKLLPTRTICVSNNPALRAYLCATRGFIDSATVVRNAGFAGVFSAGELADMLLFRDAAHLLSITAFTWNSGFSVWSARLFDVPATFINAHTPLEAGDWRRPLGRLKRKLLG